MKYLCEIKTMFNFEDFSFKLSGETIDYICLKYNFKFENQIENILQFMNVDQ